MPDKKLQGFAKLSFTDATYYILQQTTSQNCNRITRPKVSRRIPLWSGKLQT